MNNTNVSVQTPQNAYEMDLLPKYTNVQIGDIATVRWKDYKIEDFLPYPNSRGGVDNVHCLLSITQNGD